MVSKEEELAKIRTIDKLLSNPTNAKLVVKDDKDKFIIEEIRQYSLSNPSFYNLRNAVGMNMMKKMKAGKYDRTLAIKGVANNLVPSILKEVKTKQNIGRVSKDIKIASACKIINEIEEEVEYDLEQLHKNR